MSPAPQSEQLALLVMPIVEPAEVADGSIQEAFEAFDAANPWVYATFERLTTDWLARGHERIGMKMLTEIVRWQYGMQTEATDGFKINNNFPSRYARKLIAEHPEWADAFEVRELKAA